MCVRLAVLKFTSLAAGWALAGGNKEMYWTLYRAVRAGAGQQDCSVEFPSPGQHCNVFPWQSNIMNTDYNRVEL